VEAHAAEQTGIHLESSGESQRSSTG